MAIETRRMATAASPSLAPHCQPLLGIRKPVFYISENRDADNPSGMNLNSLSSLIVGLELFKAGQVNIIYMMNHRRVSFANRTAEEGSYLSRSGEILPG